MDNPPMIDPALVARDRRLFIRLSCAATAIALLGFSLYFIGIEPIYRIPGFYFQPNVGELPFLLFPIVTFTGYLAIRWPNRGLLWFTLFLTFLLWFVRWPPSFDWNATLPQYREAFWIHHTIRCIGLFVGAMIITAAMIPLWRYVRDMRMLKKNSVDLKLSSIEQ